MINERKSNGKHIGMELFDPILDDTAILHVDCPRCFDRLDENHIQRCFPDYGGVRRTLHETHGGAPKFRDLVFSLAYVFLARNCKWLTDYDLI